MRLSLLKKNCLFKGTSNIYCNEYTILNPGGKKGSEKKLVKLISKNLISMAHMFYGRYIAINDNCLKVFESGMLKMLKLDECKMSPDQFLRWKIVLGRYTELYPAFA